MQVKLSPRQQLVLGATVRQYIATARPVGSEALVEDFNPRVSPATIRNAMGYLEKAGLLYQPHTSAGRVPSDSGYRIYVDRLVTPSDAIARQADHLLSEQLNWEENGLEVLLREAAQILSTLSGYIALVTMPQTSAAHLRHLQLVQIDPRRVMLVVVLDSYATQSIMVSLPQMQEESYPDPEQLDRELQILSNFLNSQLRGRSINDLSTLNWSDLGREFDRYVDLIHTSLTELKRRSGMALSTQILISGVAEVLRRQPEFSELQQVQTIMQLLESEQDQLWSLICEPMLCEPTEPGALGKRVTIRIGAENPLEPMRTCALVSATYQRGTVPVGSVGMLGPTRMMYENAIALVEAAADYLSGALSQPA
ncbi:MAG: heat-inducible transcriptional repressor HrcA [Drouetiella hepatica Uher 2000/2452]|uniref:Heat-inducible transcription repressor HrcA n=1 Tax=Drouetiella hepatica Uher 2000/2452 TaxID=904376 RepID=A0A951Q7J1_9CYAN|nr:heat-inducible transcriptional repressor HrcA [Drouetiella hepatica Uher 2000/2452]